VFARLRVAVMMIVSRLSSGPPATVSFGYDCPSMCCNLSLMCYPLLPTSALAAMM
jgi:hypothetical protein